MGYNIKISEAGTGQPITDATIHCGCSFSNNGGGSYYVEANPASTVIVTAPGYHPTVIGWWNVVFGGGTVMGKISGPIPGSRTEAERTEAEGKW